MFVDEFSCIGKYNLLVLGDWCFYCFIIEFFKCWWGKKRKKCLKFEESVNICVGCKNCGNVVFGIFEIEEEYGRVRVCC